MPTNLRFYSDRLLDSYAGVGTRPLQGSIEVGGVKVPTDIDWKVSVQGTTTFRLRRFSPAAHEAIRQSMTTGNLKTVGVSLSFDYIPGRAYLGVLRVAYLAIFKEWGYRYILSPAAQVIRKMLGQFENPPPQIDRLIVPVGRATPPPTEPWQLFAVEGGTAVMVVITLHADTKRQYAAFMPSPAVPPDEVLDILSEAARKTAENSATRSEHEALVLCPKHGRNLNIA